MANEINPYTPLIGVTSYHAAHAHEYVIDQDGNGIAYQKCHPDFPTICHAHKIINYQMQSGHSQDIDVINGVPPHIHGLPPFIVTAPDSPYFGTEGPDSQQYVDMDGDSLFDSILPKVFVSQVTLENASETIDLNFPKTNNPHIIESGYEAEPIGGEPLGLEGGVVSYQQLKEE